MKKILFIVYLLGCYCAYVSARNWTKRVNIEYNITPTYSISDRNSNLLISAFSWCTVIAVGIVNLTEHINTDAPASW